MGFFSKLRDIAYDFVYREGDFTLQFFADFFRGTDDRKARQQPSKQSQKEEPFTYDERLFFDGLLKRKQGEEQMAYWKRRKALLKMTDKKRFVHEAMDAQKQQKKGEDKARKFEIERESKKRRQEMQRVKMAKYDAIEKKESKGMKL
tara:strand:+ start:230 stop:670 length:441 start_codon:yes stop_codon:yes gene_type:complete